VDAVVVGAAGMGALVEVVLVTGREKSGSIDDEGAEDELVMGEVVALVGGVLVMVGAGALLEDVLVLGEVVALVGGVLVTVGETGVGTLVEDVLALGEVGALVGGVLVIGREKSRDVEKPPEARGGNNGIVGISAEVDVVGKAAC
jgi:hypothetical protein